jgi:hypothetical protein
VTNLSPLPSLVEERTVHVRFEGPSAVVGVREARGWPAALLVEEDAAEYGANALGASEVLGTTLTHAGGATRLQVDAGGCETVDPLIGLEDNLHVPLYDALDLLAPEELALGAVAASRRALLLRYHLPAGVGPIHVPEDERRVIGPIEWTVTWTDTPGELVAHAICEVHAGTLDHATVRTLHGLAARVGAGVSLTLVVRALQLAGRDPSAASRELDALIAAHPAERAYHGLRAVLRARLGQRDAALQGLAAAPFAAAPGQVGGEGARAHWRGHVLLHDRLGRTRTVGADRDGAVAAFRLAAGARFGESRYFLASALTLGDSGFPFGPGAKLDAAVAELLTLGPIGPMELDLLEALVRLGRHAEAVARVEQAAPELAGEGSFFTALAFTRGVDVAIAAAQVRFPAPKERLRALAKGAWTALQIGAYDLGGALIDAGAAAVGQPSSLLRGVYGTPAPRQTLNLPEGHPALILGDLLRAWLNGGALTGLVSPHAGDLSELWGPLRREADEKGSTLLLDLAWGGAKVVETVPGVGAVVRTRLLMTDFAAWLVWEDGWRYLGSDADPSALAAEALRHLDTGHLDPGATDAAATWVRWLVETREGVGWTRHRRRTRPLLSRVFRPGAAEKPGSGPTTAAGLMWRVLDPKNPAHLRAVAATYAMDATAPLPDLRGLPLKLEKLTLEVLETRLYQLGRAREALAVCDRLLVLVPPTLERRAFRANVRLAAGDRVGALTDLADLHREAPDNFDVRVRRMHTHARLGSPEACVIARGLIDLPEDASVGTVNNVAWHLLFGDVNDIARARALCDGAWDPTEPHPALAHTRALARALQDDIVGALAAWREAVPDTDALYPTPDWAYVEGRIAEALGMRDAALAAYAKVPPPDKESPRYTTRGLADARVALLGG